MGYHCGPESANLPKTEWESLLLPAFDLVSNDWPELLSLRCLSFRTTKYATSTRQKVPRPASKALRFPKVARRTRRLADNSRFSPRKTISAARARSAADPTGTHQPEDEPVPLSRKQDCPLFVRRYEEPRYPDRARAPILRVSPRIPI